MREGRGSVDDEAERNMDLHTATALVDAYLDALQRGDAAAAASLFHPAARLEDPVGSGAVEGIDAIRAFYGRALAQPLRARRTGALRLAGNAIAFPFVCGMQRRSGWAVTEIIDVFRVDAEGRIVDMQAFWGEANSRRLDDFPAADRRLEGN